MLKNKSTKQERSNYSDGIHANNVIKKLKAIHFGAQIIAVPWREERIHSPLVPKRAKGSVVNGVLSLYYLALLFSLAYFYQRNSGKIQELLT